MRAKRRALPLIDQKHLSKAAARKFCQSSLFLRNKRIAVYLSNDGELNPQFICRAIWKQRKACYLPMVHGPALNRMWFASYRAKTKLKLNRYGIPEPVTSIRKMIKGSSLDLVLVPLVAFDSQGNRLGMGGGYYDRTFNYLLRRKLWRKPVLVGFAYDFQEIASLPADTWDIPLQYIATESRLIKL